MFLREVASHRYSVYAVCGFPSEKECEVEDFLLRYWDRYPKAMRLLNTLLREHIPQKGPPFHVEELAKRLRDNICEFRARERRHREVPRILFFEDGTDIICTNAFLKGSSTPDDEINRAIIIREAYLSHGPNNPILPGWALP